MKIVQGAVGVGVAALESGRKILWKMCENLQAVLRVEIRLEIIHSESFQLNMVCDFSLVLNEEK